MPLTKKNEPVVEERVPFQDRYATDRAWLEENGFKVGRDDNVMIEYNMKTNHGPIQIRFYNEEYYDLGTTAKLTIEDGGYFHLNDEVDALIEKYDLDLQEIVNKLESDIETLNKNMGAETTKLNKKLEDVIPDINFEHHTPIRPTISNNGTFILRADYNIKKIADYWELEIKDKNKSAKELYSIIENAIANLEVAQNQESDIGV